MNNESITALNELLKGEFMAIDFYEKYIGYTEDKETKTQFQKIQQDHKQHTIRIAERIQNLGGQPTKYVGASGEMAELMADMKLALRHSSEYMAKQALNGESQGIKMADEVVKGDLDKESIKLVNDILNDDRAHLDTLKNLVQ